MNSGRKRMPPPVNATYKFGQVIVLHAEDELIRSPHRAATVTEAKTAAPPAESVPESIDTGNELHVDKESK